MKIKVASIEQAIMQSVRPRILHMPLHLGLGLQMHRRFDSRILIDTRNELGVCFSYTVIQRYERYERCASVPFGTDIKCLGPGAFLQHMADNVDHNLRT